MAAALVAVDDSRPWLLTFVLALAVRAAYVFAYRASPFFSHLIVDGQWHDEWAWAWARGAWNMDGHAFFRAPLYPFWLSLVYRIFGHDLLAARMIQAVVGAGTAAAIAGSAHRFGGRRAGLAAGVLAALYGALVFFDGELLIPNLLLALMAWALFLLLGPPRLRNAVAAGALLGLAAAARPNALAVLPAAAIWVWWRGRGASAGDAARARTEASEKTRRGARTAAAWVAGLGLLPALILTGVNAAAEGTFVFVSSQGGVNFYAGNHGLASGRSVEIPELRNIVSWRQFVDQSRAVAEEAAGRPLDSREVSSWWLRRGLHWIGSHPAKALGLYARKAYYLVNAFEIPNNRDLYFDRVGPVRWLIWKSWPLVFPWGLVFPVAVVGWFAAWGDRRTRPGAALLTGWFVLYALSLLPFFITARFRLPLVIPVLVAAGYAAARWRSVFRGSALAAGLVALVVVNTNFFHVRLENPALETARMGDILLRSGQVAEGTALLEKAHRKTPNDVSITNLLADAYSRAGKLEDAARLYNDVLMARPDDPDVRFNLGVRLPPAGSIRRRRQPAPGRGAPAALRRRRLGQPRHRLRGDGPGRERDRGLLAGRRSRARGRAALPSPGHVVPEGTRHRAGGRDVPGGGGPEPELLRSSLPPRPVLRRRRRAGAGAGGSGEGAGAEARGSAGAEAPALSRGAAGYDGGGEVGRTCRVVRPRAGAGPANHGPPEFLPAHRPPRSRIIRRGGMGSGGARLPSPAISRASSR